MPKKNPGPELEWRKERNVWEVIWYERGKRRRLTTGATNRDEADRFLEKFKEKSKRRAVARLIDDTLNDYQLEHAPHTAKPGDIAQCVLNLLPYFGDLAVEDITKAKCQEYTLQRRAKVSDATIRKDLEILRAALNHDWEEKRIESVPFIWMPPKPEPKDRWLTRKEAADLLRTARKGPWYLPWFILISLYSGQRKMAVLNLTWDRVDMDNGKINWQYGKTTNKRRPRQPMPDELKMFLRYLSRYGTHKFVIHQDGTPLGDIKKSLTTALKRARISGASTHTLKHTAITWMMQNGTDIWSAAGFSGTSVKTIEGTYGHHCPDYLEEARNSSKRGREKRRMAS